ncbi:transcription termination/antitermination protein NusG [Candidatus Liberibacter americanus]|uniref:Transcription termination/antitermination protein NusG n=1 Tax=Candidatus Liberibacter americanus str. Sao Paulo TaxID=1261131 RepID=U6B4J4_9HYPH|nr:transcription termination/antitermination protein NusG [Candidatus Liberibacter americanus]AHA27815.1 Transcription antiterminator [Candidatus Liberibacter americanus str. Sao Paulo]EMS35982.1 transcription antitermination protein NusG [Candidatus Liberibacter americanus PW_SP]
MVSRWFIIQVYSNCEKSAVKSICERLNRTGLRNFLEEIIVPSEKVVVVRKGRKVDSERRFFPGYVLAKAVMNDEVYHAIKSAPKVIGFLGSDNNPSPVSDEEINRIMGQVEASEYGPVSSIMFEIGEQVYVSDGPFASFNGIVKDVDEDKSRLKVEVLIFGRATPVELSYNQVEKIV